MGVWERPYRLHNLESLLNNLFRLPAICCLFGQSLQHCKCFGIDVAEHLKTDSETRCMHAHKQNDFILTDIYKLQISINYRYLYAAMLHYLLNSTWLTSRALGTTANPTMPVVCAGCSKQRLLLQSYSTGQNMTCLLYASHHYSASLVRSPDTTIAFQFYFFTNNLECHVV